MGLAETFRVVKGTSHTYRLTFTREEDITDLNPEGRVDLTDATLYYRWAKHVECLDDPLISKSSADGTEIRKLTQSGATLGQAEVYLAPVDTLSLDARSYVYDAWVVLSGDERHASIEPSEIILEDSVTTLSSTAPTTPANTHSLALVRSSSQCATRSVADSPALALEYDRTVELWVKLSSLPAEGEFYPLVCIWATATTRRNFLVAFTKTGGQSYFQIGLRGTAGTEQLQRWPLSLDTSWHHWAWTLDISEAQASEHTLYLDSVDQGHGEIATAAEFSRSATGAAGDLQLGCLYTQYLDALVDEVRIWDDVRSQSEIAASYQQQIPGGSANLQGYWRLNNTYAGLANGYTLSAINSPVFSTDIPF